MELTRETVIAAIETNDSACVNALIKLYARQTTDEQQAERTGHDNGIGFNGTDAPFLSSLAKQAIDRRRARAAGEVPAHWTDLSPKQIGAARKCLKKYARQLLEIAQDTQADNARRRAEKAEEVPTVGTSTQEPTPAPVEVPEVPAAPSVADRLPSGFVVEGTNIRPKTAREFYMEGCRLNLTSPGRDVLMRRSQADQAHRLTGFDSVMAQIPEVFVPAQAQGF